MTELEALRMAISERDAEIRRLREALTNIDAWTHTLAGGIGERFTNISRIARAALENK